MISWFTFFGIYSHFWPVLPFASDMFGQADNVYASPLFWMALLIVPIIVLMRDYVWKV